MIASMYSTHSPIRKAKMKSGMTIAVCEIVSMTLIAPESVVIFF